MHRTILITGCSSGIGRQTALLFQEKGWNVSATMRSPEKESQLNGLGRVRVIRMDVTDPCGVESAVRETVETFGNLDVVVNNAGYGIFGPFEGASREQIRREFDTNLFGMFDVTRASLPHLRRSGDGILINISSMAGLHSLPFISLYASSKFAVEGFTECLFYELDPLGIRVKLVEPGNIVDTRFTWIPSSLDGVSESDRVLYEKMLAAVFAFWDKPERKNGRATDRDVAETVYRAATDESRRIRYMVGEDARALWDTRWKLADQGFVESIRKEALGED